jgi:hypothetical protein
MTGNIARRSARASALADFISACMTRANQVVLKQKTATSAAEGATGMAPVVPSGFFISTSWSLTNCQFLTLQDLGSEDEPCKGKQGCPSNSESLFSL